MGTLRKDPPPLLQDLKVTIERTCLVFPAQEISDQKKEPMFLSNIDQVLTFDVPTLHFFQSHSDFPAHVVVERLKGALEKLLVPYHFLGGRLKPNPETGRLEIIDGGCSEGGGAVLVVASSECSLDDIGDLVYPNPAFQQLIDAIHVRSTIHDDHQPLCIFQVTSFKCGGFAMGISTNHATFDGLSFKTFLDNLAAVAAGRSLAVTPCNDRQLLAARSPPRVTFPHPELLKLDHILLGEGSNAPVFDATQEALDFRIFRLTATDILDLKEKAKRHADDRVSRFNAITAHIWRCKALSLLMKNNTSSSIDEEEGDGGGVDLDRVSTILYAVNIRPRVKPPLPEGYAGNAVLSAYASGTCRELKEGPLWRLVEKLGEGVKRMSDEYVRSVIDWGEIHKGFPNGEVLVSSWWKLGFEGVEYPWGRPRYSCPLVSHRKDIILLFPDITDINAVNVLVALPAKEMHLFHHLFHSFLLP